MNAKQTKGKPKVDDNLLTESLIITRPFYKYALIVFIIGAVIAVAWSLFGSIPVRIEGFGELNSDAGLFKVTTMYRGQVVKVNVDLNDEVKMNDILFVLKQPQLKNNIKYMEDDIRLMETKDSLLKAGNLTSFNLRDGLNRINTEKIKSQIKSTKNQIAFLKKRVDDQQHLYDGGLITYSQLFSAKNSLENAKQSLISLNEELSSVSLSTQQWEFGKQLTEKSLENEIIKTNKKLQDMLDDYNRNTFVRSDTNGHVIGLNVQYGEMVNPGMDLATLEEDNNRQNYICDLYVPYNTNERITKGMNVEVEPFDVDHNLYGWLEGKVLNVNEYVSSSTGLANSLDNTELVKLLESKGPVYKVKVKLLTDSKTVSGFKWSNKVGPPYSVTIGTLCNAYVIVKNKAPIDFVIPIFKEYFD